MYINWIHILMHILMYVLCICVYVFMCLTEQNEDSDNTFLFSSLCHILKRFTD